MSEEPVDIELRKLEIEADLKRHEINAGIWKIALGTGVVGLAAAFFPFAQQYATEFFAVQIETMKQRAALEIQEKETKIKSTSLNRDFLASIGAEGRSKNLDDRIVLAEYYYFLSDQEGERDRWQSFLEHLRGLREQKRNAEIEAARVASSEGSSGVEIAVANMKAQQLRESSLVSETMRAETRSEQGPNPQELITMLASDNTSERRAARTALSKKGLSSVRPIMLELALADADYRTQLGLVVALTEMMRENKARRNAISKDIQLNELRILLELATGKDRTLRIYAGEFLYDLQDPRIFDLAITRWNSMDHNAAHAADARFNIAFILRSAPVHTLSETATYINALSKMKAVPGPKTQNLLDKTLQRLKEK